MHGGDILFSSSGSDASQDWGAIDLWLVLAVSTDAQLWLVVGPPWSHYTAANEASLAASIKYHQHPHRADSISDLV